MWTEILVCETHFHTQYIKYLILRLLYLRKRNHPELKTSPGVSLHKFFEELLFWGEGAAATDTFTQKLPYFF